MFKDVDLSRDIMSSFRSSVRFPFPACPSSFPASVPNLAHRDNLVGGPHRTVIACTQRQHSTALAKPATAHPCMEQHPPLHFQFAAAQKTNCVRLAQSATQARIPAGIDMNVNILTSGYWPTYHVVDAELPAELADYQQVCVSTRSPDIPGGSPTWVSPDSPFLPLAVPLNLVAGPLALCLFVLQQSVGVSLTVGGPCLAENAMWFSSCTMLSWRTLPPAQPASLKQRV